MNPVYLNNKGKVWKRAYCRFHPPMTEKPLRALFDGRSDSGYIVVHSVDASDDCDYEYRFYGVQTFQEFIDAVTYVMVIDHKKHGLMSMMARDYMPVYQHRQYDYVKNYLRTRDWG